MNKAQGGKKRTLRRFPPPHCWDKGKYNWGGGKNTRQKTSSSLFHCRNCRQKGGKKEEKWGGIRGRREKKRAV